MLSWSLYSVLPIRTASWLYCTVQHYSVYNLIMACMSQILSHKSHRTPLGILYTFRNRSSSSFPNQHQTGFFCSDQMKPAIMACYNMKRFLSVCMTCMRIWICHIPIGLCRLVRFSASNKNELLPTQGKYSTTASCLAPSPTEMALPATNTRSAGYRNGSASYMASYASYKYSALLATGMALPATWIFLTTAILEHLKYLQDRLPASGMALPATGTTVPVKDSALPVKQLRTLCQAT